MDPGEQTTGTRDEHYDLISSLYHALKGADACDVYALDAEAAERDVEFVEFFRETQTVYAEVARRAKELLGIAEVPPDAALLPEDEVVLAEEESEGVPLETTVPVALEDLDAINAALRGGVANLTPERAVAEIDAWQLRLGESGDPDLLSVAENLNRLSALLADDVVDPRAVGDVLREMGGQTQHLADSGLVPADISERLKTLGGLLASEGDAVSG